MILVQCVQNTGYRSVYIPSGLLPIVGRIYELHSRLRCCASGLVLLRDFPRALVDNRVVCNFCQKRYPVDREPFPEAWFRQLNDPTALIVDTSAVFGHNNPAMDTPTKPQVVVLTPEERLDLRKRVLSGQPLTLDEARAVIDSFRLAQGAAMLQDKPSRKREKRPETTDEQLERDLADLGL